MLLNMFADYQQPFSVCESLLTNDRGCLTLLIWSKGWCGPTLCHFCLFGGLFGRFYHVLSTIIKAQDKLNATSKSVLFNRKKVEELWHHSKWGFHKRVPLRKSRQSYSMMNVVCSQTNAKFPEIHFFFKCRNSIYLFIDQSIDLLIYPCIYLSIYPSIHPSIHLSIYPSIIIYPNLSIFLFVYLTFYLSVYLILSYFILSYLICLSVFLSVWLLSLSLSLDLYNLI